CTRDSSAWSVGFDYW
nr:immunoglobulin heavy chain junction region [Macaca mulatta]